MVIKLCRELARFSDKVMMGSGNGGVVDEVELDCEMVLRLHLAMVSSPWLDVAICDGAIGMLADGWWEWPGLCTDARQLKVLERKLSLVDDSRLASCAHGSALMEYVAGLARSGCESCESGAQAARKAAAFKSATGAGMLEAEFLRESERRRNPSLRLFKRFKGDELMDVSELDLANATGNDASSGDGRSTSGNEKTDASMPSDSISMAGTGADATDSPKAGSTHCWCSFKVHGEESTRGSGAGRW